MGPRKYTASKKVAEGEALLAAARLTVEVQTGETGGRLSATRAQRNRLGGVQDLYRPLAATANVVFADDREVRTALGLTGAHGKSYGERLDRMRGFAVEMSKPERLGRMTDDAGTTAKEIADLVAELDAAEQTMTAQDRLASRTQHASAGRAAAFRTLRKWMLTMHGHARVVLKGKPQLLEMLGIPRR